MRYWEERAKEWAKARDKKEHKINAALVDSYKNAADDLQKEIAAWYEKYADAEGISFADAKKRLDERERRALTRSVKAFEKLAKQNKDHSQDKILTKMSAAVHINRLTSMQFQMRYILYELYADVNNALTDGLKEFYADEREQMAYEAQMARGKFEPIATIDEKRISAVLKTPWATDGKDFSARLWNNREQLVSTIQSELTRALITGADSASVAKTVAKKMNAAQYAASRLVSTEITRIITASDIDTFAEMDIDEVEVVGTLDLHTCDTCGGMDGNHMPRSEAKAGTTAPPFHPNCRCVIVPYDEEFRDEYRIMRDPVTGKSKIIENMTFKEWKEKYIKPAPLNSIRTPIDVEFEGIVSGCKPITDGRIIKTIEKYGQEAKVVTLNKRNTFEWDELSGEAQKRLTYYSQSGKPFHLAKGEYEVQRYVEGSVENAERDEIAKKLNAEYIGFSFQKKNGHFLSIDFYRKGDDLFCSVEKADLRKELTNKSLNALEKSMMEREKIIVDSIGESNCKNLLIRNGDDWLASMREFHKTIQADGNPSIISDAEYDAIQTPTLYRGIAPQSRMRRDITTDKTPKEMADEFFNGDSPFPSRGVYGDGVAYAAPAYRKIAWKYATGNGARPHGGVIIEFKLKPNARTILYEDALDIFRQMSKKTNSKVLFNPDQKRTEAEVGKAMNVMGYDAIIKHNGDDTGVDFYVILNRGALVAKKKYITKAL